MSTRQRFAVRVLAVLVLMIGSACLLLRRDALDQVGLLDEEYFIYGDEADLQYRLQQAGWQVYYLPTAYTIHYGGRSMDRWRRRKMVYRGKMLFYRKNYGPMRTAGLRLMVASLSLAKVLPWGAAFVSPWSKPRSTPAAGVREEESSWRVPPMTSRRRPGRFSA